MVVVSTEIPVTKPLDEPIVAAVLFELAHVPPNAASLNKVVDPMQTPKEPSIGVGIAVTETAIVAKQPLVVV